MSDHTQRTIERRFKSRYLPFDALYDLSPDPTALFLPPSRACLGIISRMLPQEAPLEFNPCEYMGLVFQDGEFHYIRPQNGFKDYIGWSFDPAGGAGMEIENDWVRISGEFQPDKGNGLDIHFQVFNKDRRNIAAMYINPCLRYQNIDAFRGEKHQNIFVRTTDGAVSISSLNKNGPQSPRLIVAHPSQLPRLEGPFLKILLESLLKSRLVRLVENEIPIGCAISCADAGNTAGLALGFEGILGFMSRSEDDPDSSGCMHVLPLIENLKSNHTADIKGAMIWDRSEPEALLDRCHSRIND